jgi:hypothetical protein
LAGGPAIISGGGRGIGDTSARLLVIFEIQRNRLSPAAISLNMFQTPRAVGSWLCYWDHVPDTCIALYTSLDGGKT